MQKYANQASLVIAAGGLVNLTSHFEQAMSQGQN